MGHDIQRDWQALVTAGELDTGSRLAQLSAQMRAEGEWPEGLHDAPLIIDTDIGGDPDDAIAIAIAARYVPQLALVLTTDEPLGKAAEGGDIRARFCRHLLDQLGRTDVAVRAGARGSSESFCCVQDLVPVQTPRQSTEIVEAVRALATAAPGPIRWLGIGPMSNLARVLSELPEMTKRLRVTQMGGALQYRHPDRAEHNIRLDLGAAQRAFDAVRSNTLTAEWILADVTFTPETQLTAASAAFRALKTGEPWARLLAQHMEAWFSRAYPHTMQHDALALSAALELPFVDTDRSYVSLGADGRMSLDDAGVPLWLSRSVRYEPFMRWVSNCLGVTTSP